MKLHHAFKANVDINAPGTDPGARFYAWVWRKHFKHHDRVSFSDMHEALNMELATYHGHVTSHILHYEMQFSFSDEHNLTMFMLTWS